MSRGAVTSGAVLVALAAAWLVWRWAPPWEGRLLFGGWRASDLAAAAGLLWCGMLTLLAARSRRAMARFVLATAAGGFAWGVAELAWRLLPQPESKPWLGGFETPSHEERGTTVPDIALTWGVPGEPVAFHYVTNAWGYRNPPDLREADVYCVGDSMLLAVHHPWEDTIPGLLHAALARPVGNISLIDKAPQDMQRRFLELPVDLRGKVVLQFLCEENDLADSYYYERDRRRDAPMLTAQPVVRGSLTNMAVLALQRWTQPQVAEASRRWGTFAGQRFWFLYRYAREPAIEAQVEVICRDLEAFAVQVRERGGTFGVVLIPSRIRVLGPSTDFPPGNDVEPLDDRRNPLSLRLPEWSRGAGIPYLDAAVAFEPLVSRGVSPWFANDTHLNEHGLRALADSVLAWPWFREQVKR